MDHRVERLARRPCGSRSAPAGAGRAPGHRLHAAADGRPRRRRRGSRWSSRPAARMPDAQTLLIVSEETSFGIPALICAWREGIWPWPACSTWPMTTCSHLLGLDVGALERGRDRDAAELGGVEGRQAAAQLADGRAGGAEDHGLGHRRWHSVVSATCRCDVRVDYDRNPPETGADTIVVGVFEGEGVAHDVPGGELAGAAGQRRGAAAASASSRSRTPTGKRWIARRPGRARRVRPRARPGRGRPSPTAAPASSARATLCWEVPHHVGDDVVGRPGRGHAAARLPLRPLQVQPTRTTNRRIERLLVSRPPRRRRAGRRARPCVAEAAERRARPAEPPANDLTPTALAERRRASSPTSSTGSTVEVDGPRRDRGRAAWARSPPSRRAADEEPQLIDAALRAGRARRPACWASSARP